MSFYNAFLVPFAFLHSLLPSNLYEYVFALSAQNSLIILPPSSSLNLPNTFFYLAIGNGLGNLVI